MNTLEQTVRDTFFTATYVKLDGTRRTLNGRLGVTKYLKGGRGTNANNLVMYELGNGYKALRPNQILKIQARGKTYAPVQLNKDAPVYFVEM